MTSPVPAGQGRPQLQAVSGDGAVIDGQWTSDHWDAGGWASPSGAGAARPASAGSASPGSASSILSSAGPGSGWRPGAAFATIDAGALALTRGDACNLPFNPVLADSSGWPCLRF